MALPAVAPGSVQSQMWRGVERIVLDCRFDPSVKPDIRASLCRQLRAKAQRLTGYHVTLATRADLGQPTAVPREVGNHLVIHIDARLKGGKDGAQSLIVSVFPERPGIRTWEGPWSRPSDLPLTWKGRMPVVGGPVRGFELLLSGTQKGRLPLRSDRY